MNCVEMKMAGFGVDDTGEYFSDTAMKEEAVAAYRARTAHRERQRQERLSTEAEAYARRNMLTSGYIDNARVEVFEVGGSYYVRRRAFPVPSLRILPSRAATLNPPGPPFRPISASGAPRSPRPGVRSDTASSMLVLPAPFSPDSTTKPRPGSISAAA
jgi:hypothetical protein